MQTIEVTGKSVQEATQTAAQKLGATPDQLLVTVLEEHQGLFGKATVRIRAQVPESRSGDTPTPYSPPQTELAPETSAVSEIKEADNGRLAPDAPSPEPAPANEIEATEEDADRLLKLVNDTLNIGELEVEAKVTGTSGRYVNIELDGRDVAFLVGKHGEVLNAMQYVVNIIANQQYGNGIRVTLDGNNYRHRREEALTKLANKIADQVKQRGEEAVLDALPAFERRIVHKALAEHGGVSTYSEGEEPNRRVVIAPAD